MNEATVGAVDADGRRICGAPLVPGPGLLDGYTCSADRGHNHRQGHQRAVDVGPFQCHAKVRPTSPEYEEAFDAEVEKLDDFIRGLPSVPVRPNHEWWESGATRMLTRKSQARFDAAVREAAARIEAAFGDTWAYADLDDRWSL